MSRSAKITDFFGDARYDFRLGIGEIEELQELFDFGLMPTLDRVTDIDTRVIKQVLRLGLIGGGMRKEPAFLLVERHVQPGYLVEVAKVAGRVVRAVLQGVQDEPLGEAAGEEKVGPTSPAESSASPTSTASAPSLD